MYRKLLVFSPLLAGTLGSATPDRRVDCEPVEGSIRAHVDTLRPAGLGVRFRGRGRSAGDLNGAVSVDVVRRVGDPRFKAEFTISSGAGALNATGIAHTGVGVDGVYPVHVTLNLNGGTGAYAGSVGELDGRGKADKGARTIHLEFSGKLCRAVPS